MSTIFTAPEYNPRRERRKKIILVTVIVVAVVVAALLWWFRYWPEERVTAKFLDALQKQDYERAFALWNADPNWKQHVDKYSNYPFGQFQLDWGPTGPWGAIQSVKIEGASLPKSSYSKASYVLVVATINGRSDKACLAIQKDTKALGYAPVDAVAIRHWFTATDYSCLH